MGINEQSFPPGWGSLSSLGWGLTEKVSLNVGLYEIFFCLVVDAPHLPGVGVSSDRCIIDKFYLC